MDSASLDALVGWIGAHPRAAGLLVALVAFLDALLVLGMLMPTIAILFAVGALLGLGVLDPAYVILCATLGALAGDGLCYAIGRRWGSGLRKAWPFTRYPHWLEHGERFFRRHGAPGVVLARHIGAVRPFVPAIAGMLGMPPWRFAIAALIGASTWAVLYLAPGWLLGSVWEQVSAVAGRLGLLLALSLALLLGGVWLSRRVYALIAPHVGRWLDAAARWARAHPRGGAPLRALLDPNAPESAALALFALLLALTAGLGLGLLSLGAMAERPPGWERFAEDLLRDLRHPWADALMARLLGLGGLAFALLSVLPGIAWLGWRGNRLAVGHWLGALLAAVASAALLHALLPWPPLPAAPPGSLTPPLASGTLVAATGWTCFAMLVADEMPRKPRAWPYVLASAIMLGCVLPGLYFATHRPGGLLASLLLGLALGLLFGMAYRRRERARMWARPLVRVQLLGALLLAALWLALAPTAEPSRWLPPPALAALPPAWTERGWEDLPQRREDIGSARHWPLNIQFAGSPEQLGEALAADGWRALPPAGLRDALRALDVRPGAATPHLPETHDGRGEALLRVLPDADGGEWQLRLWPSRWQDAAGRPQWLGHLDRFEVQTPFGLWRRWTPTGREAEALDRLEQALPHWSRQRDPHPQAAKRQVLRLQAPPQPIEGSSSSSR